MFPKKIVRDFEKTQWLYLIKYAVQEKHVFDFVRTRARVCECDTSCWYLSLSNT